MVKKAIFIRVRLFLAFISVTLVCLVSADFKKPELKGTVGKRAAAVGRVTVERNDGQPMAKAGDVERTIGSDLVNLFLRTIQRRSIGDPVANMIHPFASRDSRFSGAVTETARVTLGAVTLYTIIRTLAIMVSGYFLIGAILPLLGFARPVVVTTRSLVNGMAGLESKDYIQILESIYSLSEKSFQRSSTESSECKSRRVFCEVGNQIATHFPFVEGYAKNYGNLVSLGDRFTTALIKGMKGLNCGISYSNCTSSPFKKWN